VPYQLRPRPRPPSAGPEVFAGRRESRADQKNSSFHDSRGIGGTRVSSFCAFGDGDVDPQDRDPTQPRPLSAPWQGASPPSKAESPLDFDFHQPGGVLNDPERVGGVGSRGWCPGLPGRPVSSGTEGGARGGEAPSRAEEIARPDRGRPELGGGGGEASMRARGMLLVAPGPETRPAEPGPFPRPESFHSLFTLSGRRTTPPVIDRSSRWTSSRRSASRGSTRWLAAGQYGAKARREPWARKQPAPSAPTPTASSADGGRRSD